MKLHLQINAKELAKRACNFKKMRKKKKKKKSIGCDLPLLTKLT
jgi:hypothetical protein